MLVEYAEEVVLLRDTLAVNRCDDVADDEVAVLSLGESAQARGGSRAARLDL